ncbi:MAG: hypothetical protein MMC33_005040 [Icmadophila ericetorum]|nr:hypothetical protein [Icmadophila ericetorum]
MDHLPLPHDPALPPIRIPFVCTEGYDQGPFLTYPERQGWQILFQRGKVLFLHRGIKSPVGVTAAFIQTWLYFGLLFEAVGPLLSAPDFIVIDSSGEKYLVSTHLERIVKQWSTQLISRESLSDVDYFTHHHDHVYKCIIEARGTALRIVMQDADLVDPRIMLAIAALSEYLLQAIKDVCIHLGIEPPVGQTWRLDQVDLGQPILELMRQNRWCPFDIARIDAQTKLVGVLYYYGNLRSPRSDKDHRSCNSHICHTMQITQDTYSLAHTLKNCTCAIIRVDCKAVGRILKAGSIPLISLVENEPHKDCTIEVRDQNNATGFVAISHVWAEGLGNPAENSLQSCMLSQISVLVNKLPKLVPDQATPFWIDTICVPVRPPELQAFALARMREPYERAQHVLVLDSYLQSLDSRNLSPLELFARISCCSWVRRLWTLQEGRLAKRVWVQCANEAVELSKMAEKMDFNRVPSVASRSIELEVISGYNASNILESLSGMTAKDILPLREALSVRSVSVSTDEALCLFCLMGLDMGKIVAVPAPDRMRMFWELMPKVPIGLVFSKAPQKLTQTGFHWAPSTFLGLLPKGHWATEQIPGHGNRAVPTESGLLVSLPGYTFHPRLSRPEQDLSETFKRDMLVQDATKKWYVLSLEESWGQSLQTSKGPQRIALILPKPMERQEGTGHEPGFPAGAFTVRYSENGVVVRINQTQAGTHHVSAWRHALFQELGEGYQRYLQTAKECAQQILADEAAARTGFEATEEQCKRHAEAALQDLDFADLCKAEAQHYGAEDNINEITKAFGGMITRFCRFGERNVVDKTVDDQKWCVD